MELTGRDRSFIVPLLPAVGTATLVARTIELRSIYDARLTDEEVEARFTSTMTVSQAASERKTVLGDEASSAAIWSRAARAMHDFQASRG
jgi:hypothetical protein